MHKNRRPPPSTSVRIDHHQRTRRTAQHRLPFAALVALVAIQRRDFQSALLRYDLEVRLLDAAAAENPADPEVGDTDGAATAVEMSTAAATAATNGRRCRRDQQRPFQRRDEIVGRRSERPNRAGHVHLFGTLQQWSSIVGGGRHRRRRRR